jgi:protocatechuate 3,4-dioxygenase beta subunit
MLHPRSRLVAAIVAALAVPVAAQRASQPAPTGLVLGQVVNAATGKGVPGAMVTLGAFAPAPPPTAELLDLGTTPSLAGARRVLTTADGRFLFRDLAKGRYTLNALAPGYVPGTYGQGRPLGPSQSIEIGDGEKVGDVVVRVWPLATISGTVVDERGEPVVGVQVRCLRRVIAGGRPRYVGSTCATSDDRGSYRAASLVPGQYAIGLMFNQETVPMAAVSAYVEASQSGNVSNSESYRTMTSSAAPIASSATGFRVGDHVFRPLGGASLPAPATDGRIATYQTVFFGGGATPSQASPLTVNPGEDRAGVDLQLKLVTAVRVSGRVTGPSGPGAFLGITLVPPSGADYQSEGAAEAAGTVTDASGAFTLLGVPPGQYHLKIRLYPRAATAPGAAAPAGPPAEPSLWANMPLAIGDTDVSDLAVVLRPGLIVSGRVEFAGTRSAPSPDQIQRISITLQSAEGRTSAPIPVPGRATADGVFRTAGYPSGRYILAATMLPAGWTLKSALANGRDISTEPLELGDGDVSGVVMTFTDQATELTGTITGAQGPDGAAEVIAFPADSTAWKEIGVTARRGRSVRTTKTGQFSMTGLPPGEYFVAAVPSSTAADWRDPEVLGRLERTATRVKLGDGERKTVDLKTSGGGGPK